MLRNFAAAAMILILSGCAMFQPQTRPAHPLDIPGEYSLYSSDDPVPGKWWQSFGSEELNSLVEEALSGNFDLRTALAKLKQADAVARQAGADLSPSLDYSLGAEKNWEQTKSDGTGTQHDNSEQYSAGLGASYEVDLWGRLNALKQSEVLELGATREDLYAAAVTVSAEVVSSWIDIVSVGRQIAILDEQIKNNQRLFEIQKLRFANGQASALDVSQQAETLAGVKAQLPVLLLTQQQQLNALAVLLGRSSASGITLTRQDLPEPIPVPATGLPADLLSARPDVRAAGLRLKESDWQVCAARADRLPSITLSADAAFSSENLDLLFSNWVTTLAASIAGPVFDAGYRSAEVDRTRAVAEQYLSEYARTVAEAIQEVEDSLATEKRQGEYIALLEDQLRATRLALKDARIQYLNGQSDYQDYLSEWIGVQDLQQQLVEERATLLKNRVELYRAIGGDWTGEFVSGPDQAAYNQSDSTGSESLKISQTQTEG